MQNMIVVIHTKYVKEHVDQYADNMQHMQTICQICVIGATVYDIHVTDTECNGERAPLCAVEA